MSITADEQQRLKNIFEGAPSMTDEELLSAWDAASRDAAACGESDFNFARETYYEREAARRFGLGEHLKALEAFTKNARQPVNPTASGSIEDKLTALRAQYGDDVVAELLVAAIQSPGVVTIARERLRQIDALGHDAAHDDEHVAGEIAAAAGAYIAKANGHSPEIVREMYPWDDFPGSTDRLDSLGKAGALTAAEMDRLVRASGA